jgi:hypothetical protein
MPYGLTLNGPLTELFQFSEAADAALPRAKRLTSLGLPPAPNMLDKINPSFS